jgi:hypothetical protein
MISRSFPCQYAKPWSVPDIPPIFRPIFRDIPLINYHQGDLLARAKMPAAS